MSKKLSKAQEKKVEELLNKTFIRLRSDYGFKRAYSSPEHSEVLRKFLNALFEGKMEITDVTFKDKEITPPTQKGKRIYYDAYCTTSTGQHFIVEMQRRPSDFFGKRMVFYISACVFRQGVSGGTYEFSPVYLIVITDFDMQPFEKRLVNEVVLMERETHVIFSEDFKIYFLSMDQVGKEWEDCKTELEKRLYITKNMENLDKKSKPYLTGEYEEMFNAAEIASMAAEDIVEYRTSIMRELEYQSELEYQRKEGRKEEKYYMAEKMKKRGMPIGEIMLLTELTKEEIENI